MCDFSFGSQLFGYGFQNACLAVLEKSKKKPTAYIRIDDNTCTSVRLFLGYIPHTCHLQNSQECGVWTLLDKNGNVLDGGQRNSGELLLDDLDLCNFEAPFKVTYKVKDRCGFSPEICKYFCVQDDRNMDVVGGVRTLARSRGFRDSWIFYSANRALKEFSRSTSWGWGVGPFPSSFRTETFGLWADAFTNNPEDGERVAWVHVEKQSQGVMFEIRLEPGIELANVDDAVSVLILPTKDEKDLKNVNLRDFPMQTNASTFIYAEAQNDPFYILFHAKIKDSS